MLGIRKFAQFAFWVLLFSNYVSSKPRRLRVKTIANITAETTTETLPTPLPATSTTITTTTQPSTSTQPVTEANVTTTVRAIRRRQRPTRPPTTTTEKPIVLQTSTETSRRSRGRVAWQKVTVGNVTEAKNVTTGGILNVTETPSERRGGFYRNIRPTTEADTQSSPTAQRTLIKPRRNTTSIYNFETGKLDRKPTDQNVSTTNQIEEKNEELNAPVDIDPVQDETPKRYSSRYSRPQPKETADEEQVEEIEGADNEDNDSKGLLFDGDYRELGAEEPDDNEGAYNENIIDEQVEEEETSAKVKNGGGGKGGGSTKSEKGSGEEHHADAKAVKGHKDQKAYNGKHHFHKGAKGFHDKEAHKGEYKDEKGSKKGHKEGGGHFESGHHGEKGKKEAEHAEREEYKKGHSTRGGHVIHKKDEYEKKMEFFDESHEDGHGEKFGAYFESHAGKKGGHKKGGHKDGSSSGKHHAKKGHFAKGSHGSEDKGHSKKEGKEGMHGHHEKFGKKGAKKDASSYHFEHGSGKPKTGGDGKKGHLVVENKEGDTAENQKYVQEPADEVENEKEDIKEAEEASGSEEGEVDESKAVKKVAKENKTPPKNAEYMNEDGPTYYYTNPAASNSLQGHSSSLYKKPYINFDAGSPKRRGKFMTEEDLREDKESDEALQVFNPLHQHGDEEEHSRGYRVAEPNVEDEPSQDESRPFISRINVHSSHHPVHIVAMYKLPPFDHQY